MDHPRGQSRATPRGVSEVIPAGRGPQSPGMLAWIAKTTCLDGRGVALWESCDHKTPTRKWGKCATVAHFVHRLT